jgi:DNA-binding LacI/PurR family transcriptional regulator
MKNRSGGQTESLTQALICHIHDLHLKPGDRLPTQTALRKQFGVGGTTIQRALEVLKKSGIVEIRPHKGVLLRQLEPDGMTGREIGLVCVRRSHNPYFASLLQALQMKLYESASLCKLFLRNYPDMTDVDSLSYFDGLKRCIEEKRIQGLLTTVSLDSEAWSLIRKHDIPVVSLFSASKNKGYKVSASLPMEAAFRLVRERGFRRPAWIQCGYPMLDDIRRGFRKNCSLDPEKYLYPVRKDIVAEDAPPDWGPELRRILRSMISLPERERPDVLVIPDDFIVADFHRILLSERLKGLKWNPHFIYIRHKQLPVFLPEDIPGDYFEIDLMKYAETAVETLLRVIRKEKNVPEFVQIPPVLHRFGKEEGAK